VTVLGQSNRCYRSNVTDVDRTNPRITGGSKKFSLRNNRFPKMPATPA
jgi:hypothetical protein